LNLLPSREPLEFALESAGAPSSGFEGGAFEFAPFQRTSLQIHGINLHQPRFPFGVKRKTAPRPILWMSHQPADNRIRVHVLQFFIFLLVAIDIEIVKPRLPKLWQLLKESRKRDPQLPSRCRTPVLPHLLGHALLQHLQHRRRRRLLRLADQQVHVIRHHHISRKQKSVFPSHLAKFFYKQISRARRAKEWHPSVTTKCDKVQLPLAVVALQSLRHHTPKPPPSQTEGGAPKPLPRYSPMNYRSGMLSPHMAVKRKERDSRAGHPSWSNRPSFGNSM